MIIEKRLKKLEKLLEKVKYCKCLECDRDFLLKDGIANYDEFLINKIKDKLTKRENLICPQCQKWLYGL